MDQSGSGHWSNRTLPRERPPSWFHLGMPRHCTDLLEADGLEPRGASFASKGPAPPVILNTSFNLLTSETPPVAYALAESSPLPLEAIEHGIVIEVEDWIRRQALADDGSASVNSIVDTSSGYVRNVKGVIPRQKMTALSYAAFFGQTSIIKLLLQHGADPSICNVAGKNAIHCAILSDTPDESIVNMLKLLIRDDSQWHQLDINAVTTDGWTALASAIKINLPKTFEYLITKGADPAKIITTKTGVNKCSLVCSACNDSAILNRLLQILSTEDVAFVINRRFGKSHYTALHYAMLYARVENLKLLLERGANSNIEDGYENLPIHYASEALTVEDFKTSVDLLKESLNKRDSNGCTLLHRVVRLKKEEYAKILIKNFKADVRIKDNFGRYPLHYACESHTSSDLVQLLTDRYILVAKDNEGYAPLHLAVKASEHKLVQVLLGAQGRAIDPGTKVGHEVYPLGMCPDDRGCNVIHLAVLKKGPDREFATMIQAFLSQMCSIRALVNTPNDDGKTPLHLAIKYEMNSRIKILLKNGADVTKKDNKGRSCLESAFGHEIPVQLILWLTKGRFTNQERLCMAIKYKRYELVKAFLASGATAGLEMLKSAILSGDRELAMILVRYAPNLHEDLTTNESDDHKNHDDTDGGIILSAVPVRSEPKGILDTPIKVFDDGLGDCPKTTLFRELVKLMPDVACEALNRCIERTHVKSTAVEVTMSYRHLYHNEIFEEDTGCCKRRKADTDLIDPLQVIVDNERTSVLKHPVVRSYIYEKWKTIGLWWYLSFFALFLLFVFSLALFSILILHPMAKECPGNHTDNMSGNDTDMLEGSEDTVKENSTCGEKRHRVYGSRAMAVFVLLLALYHLGLEVYWMVTRYVDYLLDFTNFLQLGLYVSAILFITSAVNTCACPTEWQWHFGIVSVVLGTLNLIVQSSNCPMISIYVIMYKEILFTFLRLVVFGVTLISAFALIFFMMFHNPNAEYSNFKNPAYSLISSLDMTTGPGVDLNTLFNLGQPVNAFTSIPFHYLNIVVWVLLLLLFPLVFNNMLTSLAVDDVKKVREKAELKQTALQVNVFTNSKYVLSSSLLRRLFFLCTLGKHRVGLLKKYTIQLKIREQQHIWREFLHTVSSWVSKKMFGETKFLRNIEDDSYEKKRSTEIELLKGRRFDTQGFARERVNELHAMVNTLAAAIMAAK